MVSLRKVMGIGSYTTSGRGMTSYCMSDGRTPCTSKDYSLVKNNLISKFGQPQHIDRPGACYWFVQGLGLVILPTYNNSPFKYVELDKNCTKEYFETFRAGNQPLS